MSRKIIGVTVGTPISPAKIGKAIEPGIKEYVNEQNAAAQKVSSNAFSNTLKGSVSGTNAVVLTDVSTNTHTIKVNASGGNKVTRYGKNLFENDVSKVEDQGDISSVGYACNGYMFSLPAGKYTVHTEVSPDVEGHNKYLKLVVKKADGTVRTQEYFAASSAMYNFTFEVFPNDIVFVVDLWRHTLDQSREAFSYHNIQIERNNTATPYEPCVKKEYAVVDGVADVESVSPITTIISDTEGVTLEATYNRDINKAYDELVNAIIALGGNV